MAEGAGRRVTSTSVLLAVVVAATCLLASSAFAPGNVGTARADRGATFAISSSRFLAAAAAARKTAGGACRASEPAGACGAGLRFRCCGGACTDVLASASNCGSCGKRCPFGRLCCAGRCVAVAYDAENCGACGRACADGVPCTYGMCGYA
jgi:hypothetical protein